MKKFTLLFILFSVMIFAQFSGPKISVSKPVHDFGDISDNVTVSYEYEIINTGDQELTIVNVRPGCGCTAAKPDKNVLKPMESTKLKVSFNSSGRRGSQLKHIYIKTNDPNNPDYRISFKANILESKENENNNGLKLDRYIYDFGDVQEGRSFIYQATIENYGKKEYELKEFKPGSSLKLAAVSSKKITQGSKAFMTIELNTSGLSGKITRSFVVKTNDPNNPEIMLTFLANVKKGK